MSVLELKLLGQMECSLPSGAPLSLSTRKADVLLAYLAVTPGLRHPRERLTNLLWSNRHEEQARNSLRQCLSAIKKSLGETSDSVLEIERSTITLNSASIKVDALEFDQLARASDFESLSRAAEIYQGEFLEGITIRDAVCQDWLDSERARFQRQLVEVLTRLSQALIESKEIDRAIETAERLVYQDPLIEEGWRLLMRAYHEKGNRNHALKAYQRCSDILSLELGVEPEAATSELREDIAGGKRPVSRPAVLSAPVTSDAIDNSEHSIAVLPFDNLSGDPEQEYFSDGITDSILLNLSLFPGLHVKSRNSSFAFKQQIKSLGEISKELEVDYIVEGSIRKSSERIRITAQLIEAASGNQIWGNRYDAELADLFDLEEDLSRTIAATVTGQIDSDLQRIAIAKNAAQQESYDLLLSGRYHVLRFNGPDTLIGIDKLNQCLKQDPNNVHAHALLYTGHCMNWLERWVEDYEPSFELAGEHVRRAFSLAPEIGIVLVCYAEYLIFCREFEKSMAHLDKALTINPNDADALATRAFCLVAQGQYESALKVAEIGCRLDPYHPWCDWSLAEAQFFVGRYEDALHTIAISKNAPGFIRILTVAASIKLGKMDQARQALQEYLNYARNSMFAIPRTRDEWVTYTANNSPYQDRSINEDLIDYLFQAGLSNQASDHSSEVPSIAVLPFENMSGDPEQEFFSDGITNDIVTTLSHIRRLRVVARHSTLAYKDRKPSISDIAEEQGVRYILDGSVRKSGKRIRVNVQLIDSQTGEICWTENYDRDLKDIFAVQDEITKNIAVEMQVHLISGDSARETSMGTRSIKAWELVSMAWDLQDSYIKDNMLKAQQLINEALKLDPEYSAAWVVLGWTHWQAANVGFSESIDDSIREARNAADKALSIDPENAEALVLKGSCHMTSNEPGLAVETCSKAVEISPGNAEVQALTAYALVYAGEYDKALPHHVASLRLCPICPNWFQLVGGTIYQRTGDLDKAIAAFRKGVEIEPESPLCRYYLIDALMDAGREKESRACADEIRALDSTFRISGMLLSHSHNKDIREGFRANLEKVGFEEYRA
jgi:TolB-like protein/predicted Zn-dependent protease